jgi:hypothetical protein
MSMATDRACCDRPDQDGGTAGTGGNNPIASELVPRANQGESSLLVRNSVEISYILDSGFLGDLSLL